MDKNFLLWKKQALTKIDKSNIGSIDKKIEKLCNSINKRDDMFTLSSCSGRICLLEKENEKKVKNIWLYVNHDFVKFEQLLERLKNYKNNKFIEFRQESIIMHICVKNYEIARKLMTIANQSGFNKYGIIANKTKIVVELICDISIICPIFDKEILISENYLKYLVEKSNQNLKKGWFRANKLEKKIEEI